MERVEERERASKGGKSHAPVFLFYFIIYLIEREAKMPPTLLETKWGYYVRDKNGLLNSQHS